MKIYHFTKFENLKNILTSGRLFFSNLEYSNDPNEGIYPTMIIEDCLRNVIENKKEFSQTNVLFNMNTVSNSNLHIYSISFTSELSNIHNWMEYGDYGKGIAIAFDFEKLVDILNKETNGRLSIKKVEYDKTAVQKYVVKTYEENKDNDIHNLMTPLEKILPCYPFIKHATYKIENEYRIAFVSSDADIPQNSCYSLFNYDYVTGHYYLLIGYLINLHIITTIYLGSNITLFERQVLKDTLKKLNFKIKLRTKIMPIKERK